MIECNVITCLNIQTNNLDLDLDFCCALFQETNIREVNDITLVEQPCCFRLLLTMIKQIRPKNQQQKYVFTKMC